MRRTAVGLGLALVSLGAPAQAQGEPPAPEPLPQLPPARESPDPASLPPPQSLPRAAAPVPPPPARPPQPIPPPPPARAVELRLHHPQTEPGAYQHDGFYLRFGVGGGWVTESLSWTSESGEPGSSEIATVGAPIELAMGGTLGGGFVLGGSLLTVLIGPNDRSDVPVPQEERGDDHGATLTMLGLLADWYVDPAEGFHVQGMLCGGGLMLADSADSDYTPTGSGVSVGLGYEWWIGPDTSVGVLGRGDWASLVYEDDEAHTDYEHQLLQVGVMGTATYH